MSSKETQPASGKQQETEASSAASAVVRSAGADVETAGGDSAPARSDSDDDEFEPL